MLDQLYNVIKLFDSHQISFNEAEISIETESLLHAFVGSFDQFIASCLQVSYLTLNTQNKVHLRQANQTVSYTRLANGEEKMNAFVLVLSIISQRLALSILNTELLNQADFRMQIFRQRNGQSVHKLLNKCQTISRSPHCFRSSTQPQRNSSFEKRIHLSPNIFGNLEQCRKILELLVDEVFRPGISHSLKKQSNRVGNEFQDIIGRLQYQDCMDAKNFQDKKQDLGELAIDLHLDVRNLIGLAKLKRFTAIHLDRTIRESAPPDQDLLPGSLDLRTQTIQVGILKLWLDSIATDSFELGRLYDRATRMYAACDREHMHRNDRFKQAVAALLDEAGLFNADDKAEEKKESKGIRQGDPSLDESRRSHFNQPGGQSRLKQSQSVEKHRARKGGLLQPQERHGRSLGATSSINEDDSQGKDGSRKEKQDNTSGNLQLNASVNSFISVHSNQMLTPSDGNMDEDKDEAQKEEGSDKKGL
ncbi:UNKNOWN [Stylonychia lemnae]|uniref:Uncharacterized protein n=1 Tax=Stylonychia lemnae TaxID=5949 RepID=A0A078A8W3_STYLE|nr:UNKNOWN [Stylonychia lemnae]|eukprot:CDW78715.1 UNKNOWN [Stylonychia lemnae]